MLKGRKTPMHHHLPVGELNQSAVSAGGLGIRRPRGFKAHQISNKHKQRVLLNNETKKLSFVFPSK